MRCAHCWNRARHDIEVEPESLWVCCICFARYLDLRRLYEVPHEISTQEVYTFLNEKEIIPEPGWTRRYDEVLESMKAIADAGGDAPPTQLRKWHHMLTNANPFPEEESSRCS